MAAVPAVFAAALPSTQAAKPSGEVSNPKPHWIRVSIPDEDWQGLRKIAKAQERSVSGLVRALLRQTAEQAK